MISCYTIINNFNLASKIKRRGGESDALDTLIQNKSPHRPRRTLFFSNCLHYAIILLTQREKFMIKNKIKNLFISVSMAFLFALMCIMPPWGQKKPLLNPRRPPIRSIITAITINPPPIVKALCLWA